MEGVRRPAPPMSLVERARAWIEWFGLARMLISALSVVVVCAGAWFLIRSPPPPSEASLPAARSTPSSDVPAPTLSPPSAAELADPAPAPVFVHVAGAVVSPGVYEVAAGSRILGAIDAAGGAAPGADVDALNLAAVVADGMRIQVPREGEAVPVQALPSGSLGDEVPVGPLDLNIASSADLESLPGIGPATAEAIVTDRTRNGPYLTVDDLERVPGIGPAKLDRIRELVTT